jgi:uncharacterized protein YciI
MTAFAVIREPGAGWDRSRAMREQDAWDAHADFMDALAESGFIVLGGPLAGGPQVLLIVEARDEAEVRARFDADPWVPPDRLRISSVEPWEILLRSV